MKLPRDISGQELAKSLALFGYQVTRQSGSHLRLETDRSGSHKITIPAHASLRIGTLNAILSDVAEHFKIEKADLAKKLWAA